MSESPFIDHGSTRGAFEKMKQIAPDCSVILTGPAGAKVCGPSERITRWGLWAGKYDSYVIFSGRRIRATRQEVMSSRDPRFDLDLTIEMEVSVSNPHEFLRLYGTEASVVAPFYVTLRANLRERVRNRVAAEINTLSEELQELSRKICREEASHGPVTIHTMDIQAKLSQRALDILEAMSVHDIVAQHGGAFLIALATQTTDEARKRAYLDYFEQLRETEGKDEAARRERRDDFAAFINKTFGDDPKTRNKLLTDPAFLESMKAAFLQRERILIANRPVSESLVPPDTKPRQLLTGPDQRSS